MRIDDAEKSFWKTESDITGNTDKKIRSLSMQYLTQVAKGVKYLDTLPIVVHESSPKSCSKFSSKPESQ